MSFPTQLKAARTSLGLDRKTAAERLGVSLSSLEKWEGGKEPHKLTQTGALVTLGAKPLHESSPKAGTTTRRPVSTTQKVFGRTARRG